MNGKAVDGVMTSEAARAPLLVGVETVFLALAATQTLLAIFRDAPLDTPHLLANAVILAGVGIVTGVASLLVMKIGGGMPVASRMAAVVAYGTPLATSVPLLATTEVSPVSWMIGLGCYGFGAVLTCRRLDAAKHPREALFVAIACGLPLGALLASVTSGQSCLLIVATAVVLLLVVRGTPFLASSLAPLVHWPIVAGSLAMLGLSGAVLWSAHGHPYGPPQAGHSRPNVVFIVLDTVRVDHLSGYGYYRQTTPIIDAIAAEGVRFQHAYSNAPTTLPSHASMFTGVLPGEHGAHQEHEFLRPNIPTLAEVLTNAGYATAGWSSNPNVGREMGLARGFQEFSEMWRLGAESGRLSGLWLWQRIFGQHTADLHTDQGGAETTRRAVNWLSRKRLTSSPFFIFINYLEAHSPYDPPRKYVDRFRQSGDGVDPYKVPQPGYPDYYGGRVTLSVADFEAQRLLYDAEVAYLDDQVGQVVRALREDRLLDNTLLIIASDHGENFGDHGLIGHQFSVHDSLLHVPLIIRYPALFPGGAVVETPVQLIDIFPTILDVLGLSPPPRLKGHSLHDARDAATPIVSEYFRPLKYLDMFRAYGVSGQQFDRRLKSLHQGRLTYIWSSDGRDEVYDIRTDTEQQANVIRSIDPTTLADLRATVQAATRDEKAATDGAPVELNDSTKEKLRALGYIQ